MHISLEQDLVHEVDELVGPRGRSPFIASAVRAAVEDERRWRLIESTAGQIPARGHEWDDDPAAWVRMQRRADARRPGHRQPKGFPAGSGRRALPGLGMSPPAPS